MSGKKNNLPLSSEVFRKRLTIWVLYLAPLCYVASVTSTIVHEILGHGLVAWLVGGTFKGFSIHPDGMGWAVAWSDEHPNIVLAAGSIVSIFFGAALALCTLRVTSPFTRAALLLFAVCLLIDNFSYPFWNCIYVRPPGDFGRLLLNLNNNTLRWILIPVMGGGWVVSAVVIELLLFRSLEDDLGPVSRKRAAMIAWPLFGGAAAALWFTFDWNQIIEGIGRTPQFVGAGFHLLVAWYLIRSRRSHISTELPSDQTRLKSILWAWGSLVVLIAVLVCWTQYGIEW